MQPVVESRSLIDDGVAMDRHCDFLHRSPLSLEEGEERITGAG